MLELTQQKYELEKTIQQKLKEDYYQTKKPYPSKKDFYIKKVCSCCNTEKEEFLKDEYERILKEYQEDNGRLRDEFIRDCFIYYGIENHPCRDIIYSQAYDKGHAYGYSEIFTVMSDIVDFVFEIEKNLKLTQDVISKQNP